MTVKKLSVPSSHEYPPHWGLLGMVVNLEAKWLAGAFRVLFGILSNYVFLLCQETENCGSITCGIGVFSGSNPLWFWKINASEEAPSETLTNL